jgi:hypothetical protein
MVSVDEIDKQLAEALNRDDYAERRSGFGWDALMEGRKVKDFLVKSELWGNGQGADNPSRQFFVEYLKGRLETRDLNAAQWPGSFQVLEIGFGSCLDFKNVQDAGLLDRVAYTGADVTAKFCEYARETYPRMDVVEIGGTWLPFADKAFDCVMLRHVLEHQAHYRDLMREVCRVARSEIFITFFIPLSVNKNDELDWDGQWHHNRYSARRFLRFMSEQGFACWVANVFAGPHGVDQVVIAKRG